MSAIRATDPNISLAELAKLAPQYPAEALSNPALPLLLLEDPTHSLFFRFLRCWHYQEPNGWLGLSEAELNEWSACSYEQSLRIERFEKRPSLVERPATNTATLEGSQLSGYWAFFCAIGEAINGPGGYFGRNLDALNDCCRGGFGLTPPATIYWRDLETSRRALSEEWEDGKTLFDVIVEIFHENLTTIQER